MTDVGDYPQDYAAQVSAYIGQTLTGLYRSRDEDLRAAFAAWERPDLLTNAFLIEDEGPPFGFRADTDAAGGVTATIEKTVLVGDTALRGLDYDGPTDPHEYAAAVLAGRIAPLRRERVSAVYEGSVFRVGLLDPEENRRLPPVSAVPTWPIVADED